MEQLSFFHHTTGTSTEARIDELQTKIKNLRMGLFKRYSECEKAVAFLEAEVEDLVKEFLTSA